MADGHLLTDIGLTLRRSELRPVYTVATERRRIPGRPERFVDVGGVDGRENLGQAIIMRLLTPRGELSELAHPDYGSRLHELIGRQNTETTRNLVKLFILESLLTTISGGVAAESHPFPPPGANGSPIRNDLQRPPVAQVVSVYGSRDGQPHLFREGEDYVVLDGAQRQTIEWQDGAQLPDPGTLIHVNYYPES